MAGKHEATVRDLFTKYEAELIRIADNLRETAAGLRDGSIHPAHAANRLEKRANELARKR